MKLLAVVTPPYIHHGCSTRKTFWEEKFTVEEKFTLGDFSAMSRKNCGCQNVRKHSEIKGIDEYITLYISSEFDSLDKMKITYSESEDELGRSRKGLITYKGLKDQAKPNKCKKERYDNINVIMKDLSKFIMKFENYLMKVMRGRGPNTSLLTDTFTWQYGLRSV